MYDAMHAIDATLKTIRPPKRCHVTTMTFTARLTYAPKITRAFIDALTERAAEDPYFCGVGCCDFSGSVMEFKTAYLPSVNMKLFNDGAVQMTGCKNHIEALMNVTELCRCLGSDATVTTLTLILLNMSVTLDDPIQLSKFASSIREAGYTAEQPERPPSCIVRVPSIVPTRTATALVYKTGNFVMCAACPGDVVSLYRIVMTALDSTVPALAPSSSSAGKVRGHHTWPQLVHVGMPGMMHTHNPTRSLVPGCAYCRERGNVFTRTPKT